MRQKLIGSNGLNILPFSSFYYKGLVVDTKQESGSCPAWKSYSNTQLILPFDNVFFSAVSVAFGSYDYNTNKLSQKNSTCSDPTIVENMLSAIKYGFIFQAHCDRHSWRVFTCNGERVVCVNCKLSCETTEACPGAAATSFIMNPCESRCSKRLAAYSYVAFQYTYVDKFPKYANGLFAVASNTSITLKANLTTVGRIYCAAYEASQSTSTISIAQINSIGVPGFITTSGPFSLTIRNLRPATDYNVYCYTEDYQAHIMPINTVIDTKLSITTACCRFISFTTPFPKMNEYATGNQLATFAFELSTRPTAALSVKLRLVNYKCEDTSIGTTQNTKFSSVSPSNFNFTRNSTSLVGKFAILGYQGCYKLSLTSQSKSLDEVYTGTSTEITVVNAKVFTPAVPVVTTAMFSNDGQSLLIYFDTATSRPIFQNQTIFTCGNLLMFVGSTYAACQWQTPLLLVASMTSFPASLPSRPEVADDYVELFDGYVQAACAPGVDCSGYSFSGSQRLLIKPPLNPVVPRVALSSSQLVSRCDDIIIDPTASLGNGGRAWQRVVWSVQIQSNDTATQGAMTDYLNRQSNGKNIFDGTQLATIPRTYRANFNGTVSISLALTNFMGMTSIGNVQIQCSSLLAVPRVVIPGPKTRIRYSWQPLFLTVVASIPACAGDVSEKAISYDWKVYRGPVYRPDITSTSLDPRVFKLDPFTLKSPATYIIQVSATGYSATNINPPVGFYNVMIIVGMSGITASIKGGASQSVSVSDSIVLDASDSFDQDAVGGNDDSGALSFLWSCFEQAPRFGAVCSNFPNITIFSPVLKLAPGTLPYSRSAAYVLSVVVSNDLGTSSTAKVLMTITSNSVPRVSVGSMPAKYSSDSKIVISGLVSAPLENTTVVWRSPTLESLGLSISSLVTTPIVVKLFPGLSKVSLTLSPNALQPGVTYTFQLLAKYDSVPARFLRGFVSMDIVINQQPSGGSLTVSPSSGDAVQTPFLFQALSWIDDPSDYPLQFIFGYYTYRPDEFTVVKPRSELSIATVSLGRGRVDNNQVTCLVSVSDTFGAAAMATFAGVRVYSLGNLAAVQAVTTTALAKATVFNDPTAIMQVITGISNQINTVDCVVPVVDCGGINRYKCQMTPKTCGPCLPGFIGIEGDSNTACGKLSTSGGRKLGSLVEEVDEEEEEETVESFAYSRHLAATEAIVLPPGSPCIRGSSSRICVSGKCLNGFCVEAVKPCPNACSTGGSTGGICAYVDMFGATVETCLQQDMHCRPVCKCDSTRFGLDCSLTKSDLQSLSGIKTQLCSNLALVVAIQDITEDVIRTRGKLIRDILSDPSQLTGDSLENCAGVLVDAINNPALADTLSQGDISQLFLTSLAKLQSMSMSAVLADRVTAAIQTFLAIYQSSMGLGEAPLRFISDYMRITTAVNSVSTLKAGAATKLNLALSDYESTSSVPLSSVQVDVSDTPQSISSLGLTVLHFPLNRPLEVTDSYVVTLQTTAYTGNFTVGRRRLSSVPFASSPVVVTVVLQNRKHIDYYYVPHTTVVHQCYRTRNGAYQISASCPDGSSYDVMCPGTKGSFTVICPSHKEVPRCDMWDGSAFRSNPDCSVLDYSASSTTCKCSSSSATSYSEFRRLATIGVVEQSFTTSTIMLSELIEIAYTTTPPIIEQQLDQTIQPTMWAFIGLCAVVFLFMINTDQRELYQSRKAKITDHKAVRTAFQFFENVLPPEFIPGDWHRIFYSRLLSEHPWLSFSTLYHKDRDYRSVKVAVLMGNLLSIVFMSTVMASTFFADDGSCEYIGNIDTCVNTQTPFGIRNSCVWNEFNESCTFKSPDVDALSVIMYAAVVLLGASVIGKVLETLARNVLIPKHFALEGANPFPWQRDSKNKRKSNVVIPVSAPEEEMEEGPRTPKKSAVGRGEGQGLSLPAEGLDDGNDEDAQAATPPKEKKEIWQHFAPDGPHQEYWEKCDELVDAQQRVTKLLHAARLRKLQEYTDFVLPSIEVNMLIAINRHELQHFGRQLLITDTKDSKLLNKSDTIKRARFALFETKPELIVQKIEKARLLSENIKNELDYITSDQDKEAFMMRAFALNNLKGYRRRIAERFVFGEGRFESRKHIIRNKVSRFASFILLVVLWALLVIFVQRMNLGVGTRASSLWLLITLVSVFQDFLIVQPTKIWVRYCVVNSLVANDIRQIFDALKNRFVHIIQRRAGAMRDANSLVQHFNPACRAARAYPHLPISRLLLAMNDYDVPYFKVAAVPVGGLRGTALMLDKLNTFADLILAGVTRLPAPAQDIVYEFLATLLCQGFIVAVVVAGSASPAVAVLLALVFPLALGVREWWKDLLKRRVVRKREAKAQEEFKLVGNLRINTALRSDGTGLKQRTSPIKTAAAAIEKTGKDAYLADEDLSSAVDDTVIFKSKFKTLKADDKMVQRWTAYSNLESIIDSAKKKKATKDQYKESEFVGTFPELTVSSPVKGGKGGGPNSPVKSPSKGKKPNPAKPETLATPQTAEPLDNTKGQGGSPENRPEEEDAFVLPTLMRYGGGGNFGGVREKGPDLLPPGSPDQLAFSLEHLERSITANLESVIRDAVDKGKDKALHDMRRKRRKARRALEGGEGTGAEQKPEISGGPETGSPPDVAELDRRRSRRRRKKATAEEVVANAGPGTARRLVELVVERGLDLGNGQMLAIAPLSPLKGLRPGTAAARLDPSTRFDDDEDGINLSPSIGPGSRPRMERPSTASAESADLLVIDYKSRPENAQALGGSKHGDPINLGSPPKRSKEKKSSATAQFPGWH